MQTFVRNLITEWRRLALPFENEIVVAAISGGADSVSLLLALSELRKLGKLNLRFVAAHFNHNLRGAESDADERFVKTLAGKFDFELAAGSGELSNAKGNLEQNARDARYRFLHATAENLDAKIVLTAHTLNDQAETFLFNLMRGSGIEGLGGIKPQSSLEWRAESGKEKEKSEIPNRKSEIQLIRPLLNWARREDTENFCRLNEIEFRHDAMNDDLKFNRVKVRKILLPMLKEFNPKIIETLAKTATLLREDAERLAVEQRGKTADQIENLSLEDLRDVFPSIRRTILRDWLKAHRGNLLGLESKHIEAVERLIFSRKSGRTVELPNGETVLKRGGKLYYQNKG